MPVVDSSSMRALILMCQVLVLLHRRAARSHPCCCAGSGAPAGCARPAGDARDRFRQFVPVAAPGEESRGVLDDGSDGRVVDGFRRLVGGLLPAARTGSPVSAAAQASATVDVDVAPVVFGARAFSSWRSRSGSAIGTNRSTCCEPTRLVRKDMSSSASESDGSPVARRVLTMFWRSASRWRARSTTHLVGRW